MSDTQLPAEAAKKINDAASFHAGHNENEDTTPYRSGFFYGYIKGATEYAIKLHQTQQQLDKAKEALKAAQKQAIEVQENHFMCMCPNPLHLINEALSAREGQKEQMYICPCCKGDGKETCTNPDHGFIDAIGGEIQRLGCPVCGHDPNHKVKNGGKCDTCDGTGKVNIEQFNSFCNETGYDNEPVKVKEDKQ